MSSSVDNRIVNLKFNNTNFESAVKQTLSTLGKLKEALNFKVGKTGLEDVNRAAQNVDLTTIGDSLDTISNRFTTFGIIGMRVLENIADAAFNTGRKMTSFLIGGITKGGITRALNIEQAKFMIQGLGKSFRRLKGDINYGVEGTAYGFDEAAKAAASLTASGMSAGKEMKTSLRGISGMAAMTGASYSSMADIFTKIAGQGKMMGGELQQLSGYGLNAAATLAKYAGTSKKVTHQLLEATYGASNYRDAIKKLAAAHGYENKNLNERGKKQDEAIEKAKKFLWNIKLTEKDIRTMASAGAVSFDIFSKAMDKAFGEHAKSANKTFKGAMSNIKASLARMGASFVLPAIETNDKDALILDTYKKFDKQLVKVGQSAKKAADDVVVKTGEMRDAFRKAVRKNMPDYAKKTSKEIKTLLSKNDKDFMKQVHKIPKYKNKSNKELLKLFRTETDIEKAEFVKRAKNLDGYRNKSKKQLEKLYYDYRGFQFNLVTVLQSVKRFFGSIEQWLSNSNFLKGYLKYLEKASETVSTFFNAMAASLSSLDGKKYKKAVTVMVGGNEKIVKAGKLWEHFRKTIGMGKQDFKDLKRVIKGFFDVFDTVKGVVSNILGNAIKVFKSVFGFVFKIIIKVVKALLPLRKAIDSIGRLIKTVSNTIKDAITGVVDVLKKNKFINTFFEDLRKVVKSISDFISGAVDKIRGVIRNSVRKTGLRQILMKFSQFMDKIKELYDTIKDLIKNTIDAITEPFKNAGSGIDLFAEGIGIGIQIISRAFDLLIAAIDVVIGAIKNFGKITKSLKPIFKIISDLVVTLWNTIRDLALGFISLFKAITRSKAFESFKKVIQSVIDIIGDNFGRVVDIIANALTTVSDIIGDIYDNVKQFIDIILEAFEIVGKSKEFEEFGKAVDEVFSAILDLFDTILSLAGDVVEGVLDVFGEILDGILNIFKDTPLENLLNDLFKPLQSGAKAGSGILASGIKGVLGIVTNVIKFITSGIKLITKILKGLPIKSIFKFITEAVKNVFGFVKKILGGVIKIFDKIAKSGVIKNLVKAVEKIWDGIKKIFGGIKKVFENIGKSFGSLGKGKKSPFDIFKGGGNILDTVADGIKWAIDRMADAFKFIGGIVDWIGGKFDDLANSGVGKAVKGIADDIKEAFSGVKLPDISKIFSGVETSSAASKGASNKLKESTEETKGILEKFLDFVKKIGEKLKKAFDKVVDAMSNIEIDPQAIAKTIGDAFLKAVEIVGGLGFLLIKGVADGIFDALKKLGDLLPEPNVIGVAIGDFLSKGFELLLSSLPQIIKVFTSAFSTIASNMPGIIKRTGKGIIKALKNGLFTPIEVNIDGESRRIPSVFEVVYDAFKQGIEWLGNQLKNMGLKDILSIINTALVGKLILTVNKFIDAGASTIKTFEDKIVGGIAKAIDSFSGIGESISGVFDAFSARLSGLTGDKFVDRVNAVSGVLMSLAKAIGILVISIVVLAYIPQDKLEKGGSALIGIGMGVTIFATALAAISKWGGDKIADIGKTIQSIAIALIALTAAVTILGMLDPAKLFQGIMSVLVLVAGLAAVMAGLSNFNVDTNVMDSFAKSVIKISAGLIILSAAMAILSILDPGNLAVATLSIAVTIGVLAGALVAMNKFVGADKMMEMAKGMVVLSASVMVLAAAFAVLSFIDPDVLSNSVGAIAVTLAVLTVSMAMLNAFVKPENMMKMSAGMVIMSSAVVVLAVAFAMLADVPIDTLNASMAAINLTIIVLTISLYALSTVSGGVLVVLLGVSAVVLSLGAAITAVLLGVSAVVLSFGVAATMAGAGAMMFATAVKMLANMSGKELKNLQTTIQTLVGFIPSIVTSIAQGLIDMLAVIAAAGPQIALTASVLVGSLAMGIASSAGQIANAGLTLLVSLLQSIANNIYQIVTLAGQIITSFINGLAMMVGDIVNAGVNLIISLINGMAAAIENNQKRIFAAVKNLIASIINFILQSFIEVFGGLPIIGDKIKKACQGAQKKVNQVLRNGKNAKEVDKEGKKVIKLTEKNLKELPKKWGSMSKKSKKNYVEALKTLPMFQGKTNKEIYKHLDEMSKEYEKSGEKAGKNTKKGAKKGTEGIDKDIKGVLKNIDVTKPGNTVGKTFKSGISSGATKGLKKKVGGELKNGVGSIDMFNAGDNVGKGLKRGFNNTNWYNLGAKAAKEANRGFKENEDMNSPSKVWEQFGKYLGEGLVNGLRSMDSALRKSGDKAGNAVNEPIKKAIMGISDSFSDMDLMDPVIKPVVDVSGIKMGQDYLSNAFSGNYSVGLAGNMNFRNARLSFADSSTSMKDKPITITNNITVNGSDDMSAVADDLVRKIEIKVRSMNG